MMVSDYSVVYSVTGRLLDFRKLYQMLMDIGMEPSNTPSVALDGDAVRRIREEKRLTQLYVSKVVGVTTDTVSRWENNRYPTIRRDNAQKLAEALEITLSEILKQELPAEAADESSFSPRLKYKFWAYALVLLCVLLAVMFYFQQQANMIPAPVIQATRILPPYAAPGSRILIQVELASEKPLKGMILKEVFPVGWRLIEAEPAVSHIDEGIGIARWIFRNPPQTKNVFYLLEVPEDAGPESDVTIDGELIANPDGQRSAVPLESLGTMQVKPFHWADSNGNLVIDDLEILELSDLTDDTGQLNLDWDLIESLWEAGAYQWQVDKKQFVPVPGAGPFE